MAPALYLYTHAFIFKIITASYIIDDNKARVTDDWLHHEHVNIIDQRLALKWLPHRKCMAKLYNVITARPYILMKRF